MEYDELIGLEDKPVVAINHNSILTYCNRAFTAEYGWEEKDLIGKPVTKIMPPHMRGAHDIGISRFLTTEESKLLGQPLPLPVLYKTGTVKTAEHYIVGKKEDGNWKFAAIIGVPDQQ